jgi:MYXO-CTERM domain-containing protein
MAVAEPQIDTRVPEGVPTNLVALWYDDTWRDLDAAATFSLRQEVLSRLSRGNPRHPEPSGPGLGEAVLGAAAMGLGLAAMRQKRRR